MTKDRQVDSFFWQWIGLVWIRFRKAHTLINNMKIHIVYKYSTAIIDMGTRNRDFISLHLALSALPIVYFIFL